MNVGAGPFTILALLAARAAAEPDRVAMVVDGHRSLSFGEWQRRSGAAAGALRERGVRRGDRVALLFEERDWTEFAVAFCAVLRAGGAAVPLSGRLPLGQLRELAGHSGASCAVHGGEPPRLDGVQAASLRELEAVRAGAPDVAVGPDDLAQILYTSGTTGAPKGVAASHGNLAYGLDPRPRQRPLAHSAHFLHAFPIGTNAGQTMLLNALAAQPAALVAPRFEADRFCGLVESYGAGTVFVVPAMAIDLLNAGAPRRHDLSSVLLLGSTAAALPPAVAAALAAAFPSATIANYYTSTEAAPAQTIMIFDPERPTSVGRPDRGHDLMIAGAGGAPLPAGEVGEVWLRSPAAPRAYYRDAASGGVFAGGWVRMGDLGYLDSDGFLHLVDRESDVVKSGAFKVSTLRVEAALYEHPAVAEAAAVGVPHPVMGEMVAAAVVARSPVELDDLRGFLRERLAQHELPTRLAVVDGLPRNDAGKVLKGELRAMLAAPRAAEGPVPASPAEVTLGQLWTRVLGATTVTAGDDFFALGGDSLRACQLAALASEVFGVDVPASLAFDAPVLAAQAATLESSSAGTAGRRPPPPRPSPSGGERELEEVVLSAQQESFLAWMHETDEPRDAGGIAVAIRIRDQLDVDALERGLEEVVRRHEALRTAFVRRDGVYEVTLVAEWRPRVEVVEAASDVRAGALALEARGRPFDLASGRPVRAVDIRLGPDDHVLALVVHHLVFDGWSMGVLLRELSLAYSALHARQPSPLPPLPARPNEFFAWARAQWSRTREFWRRTLDGAPYGFERCPGRADVERFTRASVRVQVEPGAATGLRELGRAGATSAFMVAAACWTAVLATACGAVDVVLMSPVPGRPRPELDGLIGCFVQSLLIRVDAGGDPSFTELLARVRAAALAALDHQLYPYEEFRTRFPFAAWVRYESWAGAPHFPGLESESFEMPREMLDEDWELPGGDRGVPELNAVEQPDGSIAIWFVYNRFAFEGPAVEDLAQRFLRCCRRALERPGLSLSELAG